MILLNGNYGQHMAILAGFEQSRGEIVITLDADLQNPPEEIGKLVDEDARRLRLRRHDPAAAPGQPVAQARRRAR